MEKGVELVRYNVNGGRKFRRGEFFVHRVLSSHFSLTPRSFTISAKKGRVGNCARAYNGLLYILCRKKRESRIGKHIRVKNE